MAEKLTKAERERIIFSFLKGKPDPLYDVQETKYGKYIVKPKQIQIEEEEQHEEPEEEEPEEEEPQMKPRNVPPPQVKASNEARRERRKRNRRAKQDAKRILDALTNLINGNNQDESSDELDERPRAPQLVEQPNFNPQQLNFRRRRLAF